MIDVCCCCCLNRFGDDQTVALLLAKGTRRLYGTSSDRTRATVLRTLGFTALDAMPIAVAERGDVDIY